MHISSRFKVGKNCMSSNAGIRRHRTSPSDTRSFCSTPSEPPVEPGASMDAALRLKAEHSVYRCVWQSPSIYWLTQWCFVLHCSGHRNINRCGSCVYEKSVHLLMSVWGTVDAGEWRGCCVIQSFQMIPATAAISCHYTITKSIIMKYGHYCPLVLVSQSITPGYKVPTHISFL